MNKKYLSVSSLVMMIFLGVFGFGNIANNFKEVGMSSATMLVIGIVFYFLPLCLIMAEFGSYAKDRTSGIYSWIEIGLGKKMAYFAIWSYFIANIFYLPTLATRVPTYLSFGLFGDANMSNSETALLSLVALVISLVIGVKYQKAIGALSKPVGYISLFTVLIFLLAGVYLHMTGGSATELTVDMFTIDVSSKTELAKALGSFSWILFAFGGGEVVGPYVNQVKEPEKNFVKGLLIASLLIGALYVIGIISVSAFGTQEDFSKISLINAVLAGFKFMGDKIGLGMWFVKLMGLAYTLITLVALILWSTSLAAGVFSEAPEGTFPDWLTKKSEKTGILINALVFQTILAFLFIALTIFGGEAAGELYYRVYDMTTMALIVPYFCLGISYIFFRKKGIKSPFQISKNDTLSIFAGISVSAMTFIAFIFAGYNFTVPVLQQMEKIKLYYGGLLMFMLIGISIKYLSEKSHKAKENRNK
ncbi:MAG: amino acid permease [Cetobacterium sp.]|uniref:amino acid permease n=1 Tax=unclassified Cetobacterium TaxID=2630983 RepID=UPI000648D64E|nr:MULTISPECIES: amino acid permease [unclassified Cetobacterium]